MKFPALLLLPLMLCTTSLRSGAQQSLPSPHRHALLIAVTGYERNVLGSVHNLDTVPDVTALKRVLMSPRFGFKEGDIKVLQTPEETTRERILQTFRSFLIDSTHKGDIVFFHYSGHGGLTPDANDPTGYDRTLIPSDYKIQDPSNDITDKQIKALLDDLKTKEPASVTLSFDACHSGVIARGDDLPVRGFERVATLESVLKPGAKQGKHIESGLIAAEDAAQLGYVVISACRSDQKDHEVLDDENHRMGSLTYALVHALGEADDKSTYRDLFERVSGILQEKGLEQTPQIEGVVDRVLFGSTILPHEPTILVRVTGEDVKRALLQAGSLMGVTKDTKLDLYAPGTKNVRSATPIASAVVTRVRLTDAALKVTYTPGKTLNDLAEARAVVTARGVPDRPLRVDVSGLKAHPGRAAIVRALTDLEKNHLIDTQVDGRTGSWDLRILQPAAAFFGKPEAERQGNHWLVRVKAANGAERRLTLHGNDPGAADSLMLQRADGSFIPIEVAKKTYFQVLPDGPELPGRLVEALRRESRRRLISELPAQNGSLDYKVELRIVPCTVEDDGFDGKKWKADLPQLEAIRAETTLSLGLYFRVQLRNTGTKPAYVTILDLQPDGVIGPLWPNPRLAHTSTVVQPTKDGAWIDIGTRDGGYAVWQLTEPSGSETFVAIATTQETDFSPLIDAEALSRGEEPGGPLRETPLGKLLMSASTRARTADSVSVPVNGVGAFSLHFNVLPADTTAP